MRRLGAQTAVLALAAALAPLAPGVAPPRSWAQPQITAVVKAGLMSPDTQELPPG